MSDTLGRASPSQPSSGSRKPSQKALEMEKQWSHRFVTSQGSKIWPPSYPAAEQTQQTSAPVWAGQASVVSESSSSIRREEQHKSKQKSTLKTSAITPEPDRHVHVPEKAAPVKPEKKEKKEKVAPPPPAEEKKKPQAVGNDRSNPSVTGVERIQRMQMEESTQFSKRFVTVEQTSRVVQIQQHPQTETVSLAKKQLEALEPFPFVPDPPQRSAKNASPSATLLKRPTKFVPCGNLRESDYESDYDGAKIRPRWTPAGSDAEDPKYRVVRPPSTNTTGSLRRDSGKRSPTPPTVFDNPPEFHGPPRPVISPADALLLRSSSAMSDQPASSPVVIVKPKAIRPSAVPPQQKHPSQPPSWLKQCEQPVYCYADPPPAASIARKCPSPFQNQL